jgi:hypothetical protein
VITTIKNKGMNLQKRDKNPLPALLSIFICFLKALVRMVIGLAVLLTSCGTRLTDPQIPQLHEFKDENLNRAIRVISNCFLF